MPRTRSPIESDERGSSRPPPASVRRMESGRVSPHPPGPQTPREPAPLYAFLEMHLAGEPTTRRVPGVGLLLDHHTVSRRHAEMVCDPFGRWWIRDLGSTNGTTLGGDPIAGERVLSPGDTIGIGDYALVFSIESAAEVRETF